MEFYFGFSVGMMHCSVLYLYFRVLIIVQHYTDSFHQIHCMPFLYVNWLFLTEQTSF